jgi:hypothetical protein
VLASKAVELILEDIKKNGDKEIYCGFPTKLGFGVESIRPVTGIENGAVFGKPVTYIRLS